MLGDGTISGEEPLSVARGLKSLHASFPLTRRLLRVLYTSIEIPMLARFHTREELALSGPIALELVGHDHTWDVHSLFERFTNEPFRGLLIPPALHPVNPALGTAGNESPPAVVIHKVQKVELDEMWSFVGGKQHPRWLWHAIDHHTGRVLAFVVDPRKDAMFLKLQVLLAPFGITRYYTDKAVVY